MRLKEADEAIRKAVELDSNDKHLIAEEAIIKEWEPSAERYADASNLADAIKLLEPIAADLPNIGEQDLLPSALFYARRFSDVQAFYDRELLFFGADQSLNPKQQGTIGAAKSQAMQGTDRPDH